MAGSSWKVIKQLGALFGGNPTDTAEVGVPYDVTQRQVLNMDDLTPEPIDTTQRYRLDIDLAAMGTRERVTQCKRIYQFWQRMRDDAKEAVED